MAVTTKQLCAISHLHDLSNATLYQNTELRARVAELEAELAAVKSAYTTATDIAALDKKAHNAQLSSLNRHISAISCSQAQDPLVLCVLDGDRLLFLRSLIEQGYQGGWKAAQEFTKAIAQELVQQGFVGFERLSFWITIYLNKRAVVTALRDEGMATPEQFEAFLVGFGQASPRFVIMDSGPGRESTEVKVKEYVKTYIRFPQTLRLFFGGIDDAYLSMYSSLEKEELVGKLVLVQPPSDASPAIRQMVAKSLQLDGLFMEERLTPLSARRPCPLLGLTEPALNPNVVTNGGLISPQSEGQGSMGPTPPPANRSPDHFRLIDPSKPLHKRKSHCLLYFGIRPTPSSENPPPCNEYYLMECSKGANCKYSHEWLLNSEQLETLARNAKKAPCNYLKNGLVCPWGDKCCWGHVCPSGARCFHLSKGKCWFKGDGMHPVTPGQVVETV
ncbi:hypothetical protein L227DRAFT_11412 [Lentinus tigrinus ALCF2SS1-6]|uniref:C3H1-type domain-containing protein n=1 Tax=Lentinus tigrinus ALCF2SS1-6 TaxID=1328759 RepID=A0A5C2SV92_9APHY|nr:hypothetical protein L227DRAFT_11412 [Lentinus tigrinus ALCF2SS1-6]